jgi:glycosyltransferase involved in cell wall biosynthesis
MNICMFTNTYLPHVGGVANSVAAFSEDLRRIGHRVLVVAPEFEEETSRPQDEEETVVRLPAIQNFNGSDFSVRVPLPFLVADRMEAFEPDIIHSHHPYLLGDSALRTAKQRGIPLVFTHHTLYEQYTHYVTPDSEPLKRFAVHLSTEYANRCARVIAPSVSIARLIRERGVMSPVDVIPTGIDIGHFASGQGRRFRGAHGISRDVLVVGHVGRLAPEKNIPYLARAVAGFLKRRKDAVFLVIGSGSSETDIVDILTRGGFGDRLFMVGSQTGDDLRDGYCAMDIFAFSSQSETQGLVLTEAMAAGVPVIALDGPGVREVVRDRKNGRLLPADARPEDFAKALFDWARSGVGDHFDAIRASVAAFDRLECVSQLVDLYEAAVDANASDIPEDPGMGPFDSLLDRIRAEWDLVESKVSAAVRTLTEADGIEDGGG